MCIMFDGMCLWWKGGRGRERGGGSSQGCGRLFRRLGGVVLLVELEHLFDLALAAQVDGGALVNVLWLQIENALAASDGQAWKEEREEGWKERKNER